MANNFTFIKVFVTNKECHQHKMYFRKNASKLMVDMFVVCHLLYQPFLVKKMPNAFQNENLDLQFPKPGRLMCPHQVAEGHQPSAVAQKGVTQQPEFPVHTNYFTSYSHKLSLLVILTSYILIQHSYWSQKLIKKVLSISLIF